MTIPNRFNALASMLAQINTHGLASLIAISDVGERMTKKSRSTKLPPPSWSEGLICVTRSTVNINHDYERSVNNQIKKNGFPQVFTADPSTVSVTIPGFPNDILRQGANDPSRYYVRVFIEMGAKTTVEAIYLNGKGQDVTSMVTEQFKDDYFPKKYGSVKQMLHGAAKETKPREYKAENIVYLQKGDLVFNNLSKDLMDMFDLQIA
jgi:hypothetical protein